MAALNFDSSQVAPDKGILDPVPPAWYKLMVKNSDVKENDKQTGWIASMEFTILEGIHQGRSVFNTFNLRNNSAKAQEIGQAQLSALCHACGHIGMVKDSVQLHNIPFWGKLTVKPAEGQYSARNEFGAYRHISDPSVAIAIAEAAKLPGAPALAPLPFAAGAGAPAATPPAQQQPPAQQYAPPYQAPQQQPSYQAPQQFAPGQAPVQPWEQAQQPGQPPAQATYQAPPVQQQQPPYQQPQAGYQPPQQPPYQAPQQQAQPQFQQPPAQQAQPAGPAGAPAPAPMPPWLQQQQPGAAPA